MFLGSFVRPAEETGTGAARVEAVYGYVVHHRQGIVLLDTGLGEAGEETEAWYRPRRIALPDALSRAAGIQLDDVAQVVNCHLHFDHCGGNPLLSGKPIVCQRQELATAQAGDYTVAHLVDHPGVRYELLDGETEILPGVYVIPLRATSTGTSRWRSSATTGPSFWQGSPTTRPRRGAPTY